jgi:foldase protein PrsA
MRTAVACIAAIATAVGVGACGGSSASVPSGDVAVVGNYKISLAQFDHWLLVANDSQYVNTGETPVALPKPPDYTACIASERARAAKGTSTSTLKGLCSTSYTTRLMPAAVAFLAEAAWFQGEAVDRHLTVTTAAALKAWDAQKAQEFPTATKLDDFLSESGYTVSDLEYVERLNLLQQAILKQVEAKAGKVGKAQIASYYKAHLAQYSEPERRNIELVLAKTAATAAKVKSLLSGGASFATVAKKYSIDTTTKANGGVADGVEQGEETPALNTAVFAAPTGKLEGPIKTAFGYYVFQVTEAIPKTVESLKEASATIKEQLAQTDENAAVDKLRTSFTKKWKARTTCASGYLTSEVCANAPATSSTGTSGTT